MGTNVKKSVGTLMPYSWRKVLQRHQIYSFVCEFIYESTIPVRLRNKYHCHDSLTKLKCLYTKPFTEVMKPAEDLIVYRRGKKYVYNILKLAREIENFEYL